MDKLFRQGEELIHRVASQIGQGRIVRYELRPAILATCSRKGLDVPGHVGQPGARSGQSGQGLVQGKARRRSRIDGSHLPVIEPVVEALHAAI